MAEHKDNILPSPIDCYNCKKGFHPNFVYTTKDGNTICDDCILIKGFEFTIKYSKERKNADELYQDILTKEEYQRFIENIKKT